MMISVERSGVRPMFSLRSYSVYSRMQVTVHHLALSLLFREFTLLWGDQLSPER